MPRHCFLANFCIYSWKIAGPVVFGTIIILMRDIIYESVTSLMQRRHVLTLRRLRWEKSKKRN